MNNYTNMNLDQILERNDFDGLVKLAETNRHEAKTLIKTVTEAKAADVLYHGLSRIVRRFRQASDAMFFSYINSVKNWQTVEKPFDAESLAAFKLLDQCRKFLEDELDNCIYVLNEYDEYNKHGHLISTYLLGKERTEADCYDHLERYTPGKYVYHD